MKKLLFLLLFATTLMFGQIPQGISHRGTVYNPTTGAVIVGTVTIRISILEGSSTGTSVYSELYTIATNNQGQYSLNIGTSSNHSTPPFDTINWGTNSKYLKVEIDPSHTATLTSPGSSFSISGSNQLMSVPYALYSEKSNVNSSVMTFKSIDDLCYFKDFNPDLDNVTVIVQGYFDQLDGGGGIFVFRKKTDLQPNTNPSIVPPDGDGGVFIKSNVSEINSKGLWVRQFSGDIDVRYYGVFGYGNENDPDIDSRIQRAIDYAYNNKGDANSRPYKWSYNNSNTVYFPNGDYVVGHFTLKNGVSIKGSSIENTSIRAKKDAYPYLITMAPGVNEGINISNILFVGTNDPSSIKGCMRFQSQADAITGAGGLWSSTIKNVKIIRFTGNSISFEGGTPESNYQLPNQFITMEGVQVESVGQFKTDINKPNNNYHALNIVGQNGQFNINNCRFDGGDWLDPFPSTGSRKYVPNGINVYISAIGESNPQMINFNTCTIQNGETGVFINSAVCVNLYGCWFENFERAIIVKGNDSTSPYLSSKSINITGCKFQFSAGELGTGTLPDNTGRVILVENSQVNVQNNYIIDPMTNEQTYFISVDNNSNPVLGITSSGNYFETTNPNVSLSETSGIMQKIGIGPVTYPGGSITGIDVKSQSLVFVTDSGTIERINSMQNAGEMIVIRCNSSGFLTFLSENQAANGKNIYLSGKPSLTLVYGQTATFVKVDNVYGNGKSIYQLVSVSTNEDSGWINVSSFSNSCTSYDANSTVRFRKKNGIVILDGNIKGGATVANWINGTMYNPANLLFTLPSGYRPTKATSLQIIRAGNAVSGVPTTTVVGRIDIDMDGKVYGVNYSTVWNSLSGIQFFTD